MPSGGAKAAREDTLPFLTSGPAGLATLNFDADPPHANGPTDLIQRQGVLLCESQKPFTPMVPVMPSYEFETGVYRPPSEGGSDSLLVRFTRNCPWNHCTFCGMYKPERFEVRPVDDIKRDIDRMANLCEALRQASRQLGMDGRIGQQAALSLMTRVPALNHHPGFVMLYHWLLAGGRTAFIQDANSLVMKTDHLVEALQHLRRTFPSLERVTSYARSRTLAQKSPAELAAIRQAGLDRLHVGLESGDDTVLNLVRKGSSAKDHVRGGRKALAAGFTLSEYWMPGIGGRALSTGHALNTARVLNDIGPHYIRSRPFHPWPGTPLQAAVARGEVELLTPAEQLRELQQMIGALELEGRVCFDHAANYWQNRRGGLLFSQSYEGYGFPEAKDKVLALITEGLQAEQSQRMSMRM